MFHLFDETLNSLQLAYPVGQLFLLVPNPGAFIELLLDFLINPPFHLAVAIIPQILLLRNQFTQNSIAATKGPSGLVFRRLHDALQHQLDWEVNKHVQRTLRRRQWSI